MNDQSLLQRIAHEIAVSIKKTKFGQRVYPIYKEYISPVLNKIGQFIARHRPSIQNRRRLVFILLVILVLCLCAKILFLIFGDTGKEIRKSEFVEERSYIAYTNAKRGDILASDGRFISMEVPRYKLTMDFRSEALKPTSISRYRKPELYKQHLDSLTQLFDDELDSLAVLICDKKLFDDGRGHKISLGQRYSLSKWQLRNSWRQEMKKKDEQGDVLNRAVPMLAYGKKKNPAIDWKTYVTLAQYPPFSAIKRKRDLKIERETGRPKRYKSLLRRSYNTARRIEFDREYPFGRLANATIGTCKPDRDSIRYIHGESGLELGMDSLLNGQVGERILTKSCGVTIKEEKIKPAIDGANIYTTLDMNMQNICHTELEKQLERYNAVSGHCILLDVKTGAIKAMVNLDRRYIRGKRVYVEEQNHAVQDRNEPGSSIKTASMMVALEDRAVTPYEMINTGGGSWSFHGARITDWRGFGKIPAHDVIKNSSNVGISKIITRAYWENKSSLEDKIKAYDDYVAKLRALAFDYEMDLPLPLVNRPIIRSKADWDESAKKKITGHFSASALSSMSYGYALEIPSIYLAAFYNGIANNGRLMKPYLIEKVTQADEDGKEVLLEAFKPTVVKEQMASEQTIKDIKMMLAMVTEKNGTGNRAYDEALKISGKTATARAMKPNGGYYDPSLKMYRVSFSSFFPSEDPLYTCFVLIDKADRKQGLPIGGGAAAAPVVLNIAKRLLPFSKMQEIEGVKDEKNLVSLEAKKDSQANANHRNVPDFRGMNADAAFFLAHKCGYGIRFEGNGRVVRQNIPAGNKLQKGKVIRLTLD